MSDFKLIKSGIDPKPFLEEVALYEDYWDTKRARAISVQRETLSMPLIMGLREEGKETLDSHTQIKTILWDFFPYTTNWLEGIATELQATLSRVNIISLKPEGKVYRHFDRGEYYKRRDRYHFVLQSRNGTKMIVENEERIWKEGELWWFDNKKLHEVENLSDLPRIHIVFDLLPNTVEAIK